MPAPHIEKAERKQSHSGVCIAVAQVLRLRSLGQPWRMKQIPRNSRITSRDAWARVEGAAGTSSSTTVISIWSGQ